MSLMGFGKPTLANVFRTLRSSDNPAGPPPGANSGTAAGIITRMKAAKAAEENIVTEKMPITFFNLKAAGQAITKVANKPQVPVRGV